MVFLVCLKLVNLVNRTGLIQVSLSFSSAFPLKPSQSSRLSHSHVFLYNPGAATSLDQLYMRILHVDVLVVAPILVLFSLSSQRGLKSERVFV